MAAPNLASIPEFLVFPTGSPDFAWRIMARETGRIIARFRHLDHALDRAEELNIRAMFPELPEPQFAERHIFNAPAKLLGTCQGWYDSALDPANSVGCDNYASITDLETGCSFCVSCWKEYNQ